MGAHGSFVGRRAAGAIVALVVLAAVAMAPAFACTGNRGSLTTNPAHAAAGTGIDLMGTGFEGQVGASQVEVRWGGGSGVLIAQVTPDEGGVINTRVTVPAGAEPGWHQITASQKRADSADSITSNYAFEVDGVVAAAPAPAPVTPQPAVTEPAPATQPAAAAPNPVAPAPATSTAKAPAAVTPVAPAAPVAAAPVAAAPVAAAPVAPEPAPAAVVSEPSLPAPADAPIPALPGRDPVAMGGPRTIGSGPSLWLLAPLAMVGLTLFAASCAVVVHDVRQRRARAGVKA